ncbi:MAG TPA: glycosyltransferase family 4 protein [Acidimicrobiales bacterium]|nr:glycosyltransferase family 4 protein [Acidimicrobiales bacterium]
MHLLFVVQRFGLDIAGGAEQACRGFATRLAGRGHRVEVLTSAARDYTDWADFYPVGESVDDGVVVHRLGAAATRDLERFGRLQQRVVFGHHPVAWHLQQEWMKAQGPILDGLPGFLADRAAEYDVVVFFTYLYNTTFVGLPTAAGLAPTVLHPTAHDEPPIHLPLFDPVFRHPAAFGFLTPEEETLVRGLFRSRQPSLTVGIGVEMDDSPADVAGFRSRWALGDDPFLLFVGRVDMHKGAHELFDQFVAYRRRRPSPPLRLVFLGEPVQPLPEHPEVVVTGRFDDADRRAALQGCLCLVNPSYFESFSMVLTEAWAQHRAALVQGRSPVLTGQVRRSGGGLAYRGFAEFEAAVDIILDDPGATVAMGEAGRRYAERWYGWDPLLERYETLLELAAGRRPA